MSKENKTGYTRELQWIDEEIRSENTVRAHIKGLRQKLKKAGADGLIETVYGLGYRLKLGEVDILPAL